MQNYKEFIRDINEAISPLAQQINTGLRQIRGARLKHDDGKSIYVLYDFNDLKNSLSRKGYTLQGGSSFKSISNTIVEYLEDIYKFEASEMSNPITKINNLMGLSALAGQRIYFYALYFEGEKFGNLGVKLSALENKVAIAVDYNNIKSAKEAQQQPRGERQSRSSNDPRDGVPVSEFNTEEDTNGNYYIAIAFYREVVGATFNRLDYYPHNFSAKYFALETLNNTKIPTSVKNDRRAHLGVIPVEKVREWQRRGVSISTIDPDSQLGKAIKTKLPKE